MARLEILLALSLCIAHHASADMELDDLNDDSYSLVQGNPRDCPEKIRFRTESSPIRADRIRVNDETDCAGSAEIPLTPITSPQTGLGVSAPVRYFSSRIGDVERFFVGRNDGPLTCGPYNYPTNTQWIFLNPDEELDDVKWTDVYNGTPDFAIDSKSEVDFDDDERYLLIGDICFFQDTSFSDSVCFPGDAKVQLEDGSVKTIDSVSIGDRVHVGSGMYSEVFAWTHHKAGTKYRFVELTTEDGNVLTATGSHYIYADGQTMQMKDVQVGMSLRLADGAASRVTKKDKVVKAGLYNPQTVHGDVVVDGVVATTYTAAVKPEAAHALLAPIRAAFQAVKGVLHVEQVTEL